MNQNNNNHGEKELLHIRLVDDDEEAEQNQSDVDLARTRTPILGTPPAHGRGFRNQTEDENKDELPPSKTKIKKQMHELRDLGKELTELSKDQLAQLDIPENLRDAIREMKSISKFGAQRRQIQYIGKLMREVDPAPILARLDAWKGKSQQHIAYAHLLERWRDRLMDNDSALTELLSVHPETDAQHLRALIRNAKKETGSGKPPKNYREIFQLLKEIIPEHE